VTISRIDTLKKSAAKHVGKINVFMGD